MSNFTSKWICRNCGCDADRVEDKCKVCGGHAANYVERYECQRCFVEREIAACDCSSEPLHTPPKPEQEIPSHYPPPPELGKLLPTPPTPEPEKKTASGFFETLIGCLAVGLGFRCILGIADHIFGTDLLHTPGSIYFFGGFGIVVGLAEKNPSERLGVAIAGAIIGALVGWAFGLCGWFCCALILGIIGGLRGPNKPK